MIVLFYLLYYIIIGTFLVNFLGYHLAMIVNGAIVISTYFLLCGYGKMVCFHSQFRYWKLNLTDKWFWLRRVVSAFLIYQVVQTIFYYLIQLKSANREVLNAVKGDGSLYDMSLLFLYVVMAAPIVEEFLFRELVFTNLLRHNTFFLKIGCSEKMAACFNTIYAWLFSVGVFTAIHSEPTQMISAFILSLYLSKKVYKRQYVVYDAILVHSLFNLFMILGPAWYKFL